jgi:hypothetical protein
MLRGEQMGRSLAQMREVDHLRLATLAYKPRQFLGPNL